MSEPQPHDPAVDDEDEGAGGEHPDGEDRDEANREGIARDDQLEHAIDEDDSF